MNKLLDALISRLIKLDILVNDKWLGGRAETISGRCHKRRASGCRVCTWLCKILDRVDPGHCKQAYCSDRLRNPNLPWI